MARRIFPLFVALAVVASGAMGAGASSRGSSRNGLGLEAYTAVVQRPQADRLIREGFDLVAVHEVKGGVQIDLVLSPTERARLESRGIALSLKRTPGGLTAKQLAARQAAGGYTVWRSWDEPGGIRDELYQVAADHPDIVELEVIGHSVQGREIIALKVTNQAQQTPDGTRPAVLYSALQHAREWIAVEVDRRLLHHFVDNYGFDPQVTRLVDTRELWFVVVANPDGYQYTFDVERLWRKNLRDNDGNGEISVGDGVDPNRNFAEHWNYDEEGSSSAPSSETYRGTGPASEPETQAMQGLLDRLHFAFQVNYHSFGQLLLYTFGWQVQTHSADDPIYLALSGTDDVPAIEGFNPGVGADLYVTNGETTDYAHAVDGTLAWTPELSEGCEGCGFVFPDDEALIQEEFEKNLPFGLDLAESASDPAHPISHLGTTTEPFYVHAFDVSYGDPQTVEVNAARELGPVSLKYRINGGSEHTATTSEWQGGERFGGPGDVYYHVLRGQVAATHPGDSVEVWFEGGGEVSDSFTYAAVSESGDPVLVLSAEDYSGNSPVYHKKKPRYLKYYIKALVAEGIQADLYDVDANDRTAPDALGVLSHYETVIWYTGDDVITREPNMVPGTASRLANDEMLAIRSFLNEGGKVLYTGKYAGFEYAFGYEFDPVNNDPCDPSTDGDGCVPLSDDFLQYYLGAYIYNDDAGTPPDGDLYDVIGADVPFTGMSWGFGPPSARNQDHSASFLTTSGLLPPDVYPQFLSWASAKYDRPGGPFEPHTGDYYMYSQIADVSYKRLTRTVDLSGQSSGSLSFWVSRDTEQDWDQVFVEARTVGLEDWTTLPDLNGHTTQDTGLSCPEGWRELHPWLDHYQTLNEDGTCTPIGTTGEWNAATGRPGAWEEWTVDLTPYAGGQVEVSIAYASDWATQGLGVFVDDTAVSTGETTSFEDDLGGWAVTGPPPGSAANTNDFERTTSEGFQEGAVITTPDSIYMGFGLEGIAGKQDRAAVLGAALAHLLS